MSKTYACWDLPEGYGLYRQVRLDQDKKMAVILTLAQLVLAAAVIWLGIGVCPISAAFSMETGQIIMGFAAMAVGIFVYVLGHEWVHGVFIRLFSGKPASFGFKAGMAYAGSEAYFGKLAYIVIALAPLVVWTAILGVLLDDVSRQWFWYLNMIQVVNVSGAVGDLYVTAVIARAPKGVLARDSGTEMKFYAPAGDIAADGLEK